MATHTDDQVRTAARVVAETIDEARALVADAPTGRTGMNAGHVVVPRPRRGGSTHEAAGVARTVADLRHGSLS